MGGARELLSLGGLAVGGHVGGGGEGAGQRYGSVEVLLLLEHPLASTKTQLLFDVLRERPTSLLRDPLKRPFALPVPHKDWLLIIIIIKLAWSYRDLDRVTYTELSSE